LATDVKVDVSAVSAIAASPGRPCSKTVDHRGSETLRNRRRTAIAAGEDFPALGEAMHHVACGLFDRRRKRRGSLPRGLRRGLEMAENSVV